MIESTPLNHRSRVAAERRERMRTHLLHVGLQIVAECGPEGFSIDDVVVRAEVARGTFYKYFATPAELVRATALALSEELIVTVNSCLQEISDPALRAATGIRAVLGLVIEYPLLGAFIVRAGWPVSDPGHAFFRLVAPNIDAGLANGRFRHGHRLVGLTLVGGLSIGAMQNILSEDAPKDFPAMVAESLLRGLGVDPVEAADLAQRPFKTAAVQPGGILSRATGLVPPQPGGSLV